jgi:putative aldouronate transport system substrate-binding protein
MATPDASGRIPGGGGVPDAYTRLPEPFTSVDAPPANGGTVTTSQIVFDPPVPGRDENQFWQELERRLGVDRLEARQVPAANYEEQITATIAGGDIPDLTVLFPGNANQNQAIRDGAFTDLTPYLTGDALQEFPNLAAFPAYLWENVAIQGKIYGVPRETFRCGTVHVFRQDWVEKVGRTRPTDADEFLALMQAFTQGDPNGNGSADTWGLGGGGSTANVMSRTLFDYMFRVPNGWRLNADGTLTNAIETEEFAQAVAYMRRLFEAGVYHPDAAAADVNWKDAFASGSIGGYPDGPGALPGINNMRERTTQVTPDAIVVGLVPMGHDGGAAVTHNSAGFYGMVAIPSRVDGEERVRELLRILDFYVAPFGSEEWRFLSYGIEGVHHDVTADGTPVLTELGQREVGGDLTYLATPPTVLYYNDRPEDALYMQEMVRDYLAIGVDNPALGILSETAVDEGAVLDQLQLDGITAIVTGRDDLDALDQLIGEWRERGGDRIREETQVGLAGGS